jgi:outer membrane protein assembly factor BamD
MMKFPRLVGILTLFPAVLIACSSGEKFDTSTPEGAFKQAEEYEKDERYEESIAKYSDVKNKFPYSKLATAAELKVADVNYKREAYIEAQNAYQLFKEFHPKHPQSDYVTFRLAMSYYNQLPSSIDRDLTVAEKAILYFDEVIASYPRSAHVAEAKEKRTSALQMLAKKELYIAQFYSKRAMYDSALKRYEVILKKYPSLGLDAEALYGAALSAVRSGERDRGQQYLKNLYTLFPNTDEARRAKNELE